MFPLVILIQHSFKLSLYLSLSTSLNVHYVDGSRSSSSIGILLVDGGRAGVQAIDRVSD